MSGIRAFRKIQIGKEATRGTAVPATAKLMGELTMKETLSLHRPELDVGRFSRINTSEVAGRIAELSFKGGATFEQILYFLLMGVKGNITPTQPDGESTYLWTFSPNLEASNVPDSFTVEYGDNVKAYESEYALASNLEISGAVDEALQLAADMFARQMTEATFTPALTDPSVESVLMNKGKLYIDDAGTGIGTTEKSSTLIAFTWRLPTGLVAKKYADGELYFSSFGEQKRGIELELTFAFNSNASAERANFVSQTKRFIRLEFTGSEIETSYNKKLTLDMCCLYNPDGWNTLEERDGEDIVAVTLSSVYDATWQKEFEVAVQNALATLP